MTPSAHELRKANRRGAARLAAVQALYQMDIAGTPLSGILADFESDWIGREVEGEQYLPAEGAFFRDVVAGVVAEQRRLDPLIDRALAAGWPLKRIEAILRSVLRAGCYELDKRSDVPARVVISEYVDVAHAFVDRDETGMVNAVLDHIARQLRPGEFASPTLACAPLPAGEGAPRPAPAEPTASPQNGDNDGRLTQADRCDGPDPADERG